ncbi:MAG TPA: Tn3 family transposase, partial [Candidatus Tectomicrobia bacterium]
LVWNTVHMTRIIAQLRATGETIADEDAARISPAAFAHVIPNGTYFARPTPLESDENSHESFDLLSEGMESEA